MIYEIAEIEITPGSDQAFQTAMQQASQHFRKAPGCRSLKLERSIENPHCYFLIIGWDSIEDHMDKFRNSHEYEICRDLTSPFFASPPKVQHVSSVLEAF